MGVVAPWSESQLTHRPKLAVTGHRLIHFFINCLVWCPLVLVGRTTNRQECSISMSHELLWKCCHPCACIVLLLLLQIRRLHEASAAPLVIEGQRRQPSSGSFGLRVVLDRGKSDESAISASELKGSDRSTRTYG